MIGNKTRWMLLCASILFFTACNQDQANQIIEPEPEPEEVGYPGVDEDLWVYYERFEEEGRARGFAIDLRAAQITGEIQDLDGENVAGQCSYSFHSTHVTIDQEFWNRSSDRGREFVVFHELGHCDLGRDHREDVYSNGACVSIMRSGLGNCRDNYRTTTREIYLDELFDPSFFDEL